jgi:hypothetical protein
MLQYFTTFGDDGISVAIMFRAHIQKGVDGGSGCKQMRQIYHLSGSYDP